MRKVNEILKEYEQSEFPHRLNMYMTYRDMRGEFAKVPNRPIPDKAPSPVQQIFNSLKAHLPDFSAFKRQRSVRNIIPGQY